MKVKIKVEHVVAGEKDKCFYGGDFYGNEICKYHVIRNRTHGRKAPAERNLGKCTLFDCWLEKPYKKCEMCKKACEESEEIKAIGNLQFSSYTELLIAVKDVEKIIRNHMNDGEGTDAPTNNG